MDQIHNLYITSQNKNGSDTNYNFNLFLPSYGIKIEEDEEAYLNINGFQTLNTFYNINSNSKSFSIKVRNDQDVTFTYNYNLEEGNYNINEFQDAINNLCSAYFTITYNINKNKWNYKAVDINYTISIKPTIYNYKYFGLKADIYTVISYPYFNGIGTYSSLINLNNFSLIIIKVLGLIELNKTLDNFNSTISRGDVSAIINRQDIACNALINWSNINGSFIKKISNTEINHLCFQFFNEFNQILTDIDDWILIMSITIKKRQKIT